MSPSFDVTDLDARLAPVADVYRETKVREPGELPPDGEYEARVEKFDIWESKKGELFLSTILVVLDGDEKGAEIKTIHSLENVDRLDFLKRHLLTLGVEAPDELPGLRERLGKVIGRVVEARVTTSNKTDGNGNPYRNCYVNKVISNDFSVADIPIDTSDLRRTPVGVKADEDIPF